MDGVYNKENLFAEFEMQKTNKAKVKFLQDMKQLKKDQPNMFRGTKISQKQFDNLFVFNVLFTILNCKINLYTS